MTRAEAIRILKGDTLFNSREEKEAKEMAIETMRKFQKIDWITEAWDDDENAMILVHKIREVIEDGNDY